MANFWENYDSSLPEDIISDSEIERVHAHAKFGNMPKRMVVDRALMKVAMGYHNGHTAQCILLEHGLISGENEKEQCLTCKGRQYLVATFKIEYRRF